MDEINNKNSELKKSDEHKNKTKLISSIKSNLVMKKIFSHLNLESKLNIIKFNKTIQKKINISLEDYKKKANGRYRVKRHKGVVKIYSENGNVLLFRGKYLNEKKNGKGKEYNEYGELIYEGEYKNGKRNGKGKEYDGEGNLIFEGEYLNGKKWKGRGYNKYGELVIKKYLNSKYYNSREYEIMEKEKY